MDEQTKPVPQQAEPQGEAQPGTVQAGAKPTAPAREVIYPKCPFCGQDPLQLWRLRYDWPDGVIAETIFCGNSDCKGVLGVQIVFVPKR